MRLLEGGVAHIASAIEADLKLRVTGLQKPHISGMADLCASALVSRSSNTGEWINVIPRTDCEKKSRERYISRFLSNSFVNPVSVAGGFVPEIIKNEFSLNKNILLSLEQSKISDGFECLMISVRVGKRAVPVVWRAVKTKGAVGFDVQQELLISAAEMVPEGIPVTLSADRFYGTSALIGFCRSKGWSYRVRLKGNLIFRHEGRDITPEEAVRSGISSLENAVFNRTDVATNIAILHEEGHPEPWFIAMDCKPSAEEALKYSMRWAIECLFSDFKSRGFFVTKTCLKHEDRIERLILVLSVAVYWAVSCGMQEETENKTHTKKNS